MDSSSLLVLLLLTHSFTPTTPDEVTLGVLPLVAGRCGELLLLPCNASSRQQGMEVRRLVWIVNGTLLCKVSGDGTPEGREAHRCHHEAGRLTLQVLAGEGGGASRQYMCKLHSTHGIAINYTQVEIEDCPKEPKATAASLVRQQNTIVEDSRASAERMRTWGVVLLVLLAAHATTWV